MTALKDKIIALGGKEWNKGSMERVYINNEIFNILLAEKGFGEVNYGERNNQIFLDVKTTSVMRSYKGKKPRVEIQY